MENIRLEKTMETVRTINQGFEEIDGEKRILTDFDKQQLLLTNIAYSLAMMVDKMDRVLDGLSTIDQNVKEVRLFM